MSGEEGINKKLSFKIKMNLCIMGVAFMCITSSFNGLKVLQVSVLLLHRPSYSFDYYTAIIINYLGRK